METETQPSIVASAKMMGSEFRGAQLNRSLIQLTVTAGSFIILWTATYLSLKVHYGLTLLLSVPTAAFMVRLFMIQHDCGHGSFFKSRGAADFVGFCIGILTLIPYQYWRRMHACHHAHSGDLDFRGFGDVDTLTVGEYAALSPFRKMIYRIYRSPYVILSAGPFSHFVVKHRYPWDLPRNWKKAWKSVWWTNAAIAALILLSGTVLGFKNLLLVQAPVTFISGAAGIYLFYVQHQYDDTYWQRHNKWDFYESSLKGSSHLILPWPLQWLTANIGIHHLHHMNSLIPNYKLAACLDASPHLQAARKLKLRDTWRLFHLTLWDEVNERLIRFKDFPAALSAFSQNLGRTSSPAGA